VREPYLYWPPDELVFPNGECAMRSLLLTAAFLLSNTALAATVTINKPTQGETVANPIELSVSVSQDFVVGKDGVIQMWVDGMPSMTLTGTTGRLQLAPGNHQLQARLVQPDGHALRVPSDSAQITVTVPTVDPHAP
jgi:hypothetical protein